MSMRPPSGGGDTDGGEFALIGGNLALDFTNTVGGLRGGQTYEYLTSYADLVRWGRQAGLLNTSEASMLLRKDATAEAEGALAHAVALREAIYGVMTAHLGGASPASDDMATLNAQLAGALAHQVLAYTPHGAIWQWRGICDGDSDGAGDGMPAEAILWRVARSAADLLLSPALGLVRQCASDTCGWLFVDSTRNHQRRWCDMRGCGNRAKVRRHRAQRRAGFAG